MICHVIKATRSEVYIVNRAGGACEKGMRTGSLNQLKKIHYKASPAPALNTMSSTHVFNPNEDVNTAKQKKRKRATGHFECTYPNCSKTFTRSDHLSRHRLNHNPTRRYVCSWEGCDKSFARSDVRDKHFQRHQQRNVLPSPTTPVSEKDGSSRTMVKDGSNKDIFRWLLNTDYAVQDFLPGKVIEPLDSFFYFDVDRSPDSDIQDLLIGSKGTDIVRQPVVMEQPDAAGKSQEKGLHSSYVPESGQKVSSDGKNNFNNSNGDPTLIDQTYFDDVLRDKLIQLVPGLQYHADFEPVVIRYCLNVFWTVFHPQYPFIHRPTFKSAEAHPLLLLSIIMVGLGFVNKNPDHRIDSISITDSYSLGNIIAHPLRWLICSSHEFTTPPELWIIQSLILLEIYEINFSNRKLHERAYLHHGLKTQLLRRSPLLGGDPLKNKQDDDESNTTNAQKWLKRESMKRAAFMCFHLDTTHGAIFGHEMILNSHQIKFSLPCNENLWNQTLSGSEKIKPAMNFLDVLKLLLKQQDPPSTLVETFDFSSNHLNENLKLSGLISVLFQLEEKDMELKLLEWESMKASWRDTLTLALDWWKDHLLSQKLSTFSNLSGNYCTGTSLLCEFPVYFILQTFMKMKQYDFIIFTGAPTRMNVRVGMSDYTIVEKRIRSWSKSSAGSFSVVFLYLFLIDLLLVSDAEKQDLEFTYDPNTDPILYRPNLVALSLMILWSYNFIQEGPESTVMANLKEGMDDLPMNDKDIPYQECGRDYLKRIRNELMVDENQLKLSSDLNTIKLYSKIITGMTHKNRMVGLLKFFKKGFLNCTSTICREYGRLLENCISRSLGRRRILCNNMNQ
ncbi:GQ67_03557T0 [Komagataella phaffii]|nr:GQ67_03557T0 [Komagataella phaffii]AOA68565.1 GQ68_03527T0 [Komagataella phaffii GS115]